ncbi:hypothetical protein ASG92_07740 [Arthrobacter sp. Soil736]|uniref:hypothetical protein n=1 Tax=Arthrobacter sp. Soil736 TaxID=1736395 RepID=UPI0006F869FB|nr:hypothetical protein [Arthrobacter sp. Soil736]KRE53405.1 hypothetical protein ASG92_07740 [Arthrobacter sp. Soil736]
MLPRASFRLFRTALIGSIVIGFSAGGHLAAGGQLPAPAILAALCAVAMIPVAALTRFRLTFPALTGLLGAGQLWLHWAFDALRAASPATTPHPLMPGHAQHSGTVLAAEAFAGAAPAHDAASDGLMFAAHALATLATALIMARGEQALGILASWLRPLVRRPEPVGIVPARVSGPCAVPALLPPSSPGLRLPSLRGPPAFAPAA